MSIYLPYGYQDARIPSNEEIIVLHPEHNSHDKSDVTGAFQPEALHFCKTHNISKQRIFTFDSTRPYRDRAEEVFAIMENNEPRLFVGFMHGWTHGIQCGIRCNMHPRFGPADKPIWDEFKEYLAAHHNTHVVLYACSTGNDPDDDPDTAPGSGEDSFADVLRDDLCWAGSIWCRVVAHTTSGHTTQNPWLKFFDGRGSPYGGVGAELLFPPRDHDGRLTTEWKTLQELLLSDFRFKFPFMQTVEIHNYIYELLQDATV